MISIYLNHLLVKRIGTPPTPVLSSLTFIGPPSDSQRSGHPEKRKKHKNTHGRLVDLPQGGRAARQEMRILSFLDCGQG